MRVGPNGTPEHPVVEKNGRAGAAPLEVSSDDGVDGKRGGLWHRLEERFGILEASEIGDGVQFGEATGRVGVADLGSLDQESVDLLGFSEVFAEKDVWVF